MPLIRRVGFFHFGSNEKNDPVGSLEAKMGKCSELQLKDSLIVLPEAFNVRGGFYCPSPELDSRACSRLQTLSVSRDIAFVVGLIKQIKGSNSAYLIDRTSPPLLLSRKQCGGWDCLYTPSPRDETAAVMCRGIGITALVCDDAGHAGHTEENKKRVLAKIERLNSTGNVLCIPAFMTITDSLAVAKLWMNSITVVLANGCNSYPSVIVHGGSEQVSTQHPDENEIKLCDL